MTYTIAIIQCVCTIVTVVISVSSVGAHITKSTLTKEDLRPVSEGLREIKDAMEIMITEQSHTNERVAVLEYAVFHPKNSESEGGKVEC